MILTDGSPAITNYEPSVKINIGGAVTQAQFKFGTWYNFSMCPKDGKMFLVCDNRNRMYVTRWIAHHLEGGGFFKSEQYDWNPEWEEYETYDEYFDERDLKYFMPLPPPPTNTKEEE